MKNAKQKGLVLIWISLFIILTFLVFFIIGTNSTLLVNHIFKNISLILIILSIISLGIGIFLLVKHKKRKGLTQKVTWIFSSLIGLYIIGCITFLVLLYGPNENFKNWLITTAMATMNHQHYCKWFYSDEVISKVLDNNYIDDGGRQTDPSLIDHTETINYANEYEREILEREEGALYKVINFEVNGSKAYLGVVYDASKIKVGYSKWLGRSGQYIYDMAKEQGSVLTINGGGFFDPGHNTKGENPVGVTISNGKIITGEKVVVEKLKN